jgi:hypothetical protein
VRRCIQPYAHAHKTLLQNPTASCLNICQLSSLVPPIPQLKQHCVFPGNVFTTSGPQHLNAHGQRCAVSCEVPRPPIMQENPLAWDHDGCAETGLVTSSHVDSYNPTPAVAPDSHKSIGNPSLHPSGEHRCCPCTQH